MDRVKAEMLEKQLAGQELDGWIVERLVNHGKSAAVFAGRREGNLAAVKVFDTELIERYGDHAQLARIERELELRGQSHEHLVGIYGGGYDKSKNLYFIVMEYLDGPNLKEALAEVRVEQISDLTAQLASAARFLEDKGLVHRDIKPENIALLDGGRRLVLLDFGVIRPIKGSDLTDPEGIHAFVGTLQYSSPEFLLRDEKQDIDGWRALTFYQIGAVLHDLLVKRPIFEQFANPYAKLVNAVQFQRPAIVNPDAPPRLIQLAERCLLKNPAARLRVLRWEDFAVPHEVARLTARERVAERMVTLQAQSDDAPREMPPTRRVASSIKKSVIDQLKSAVTIARASMSGLPPLSSSKCRKDEDCVEFSLEQRTELGFPHGLKIRVCVDVVDAAESVVSCTGCAYLPGREGDPPGRELISPWFQGVLDTIGLSKAFEDFFFEATEWCLQVSPGVGESFGDVFRPTQSGEE